MRTETLHDTTIAFDTIPDGERTGRLNRERSTVARMLNNLLGDTVTVGHTPQGAPFIVEHEDIFVSISHSLTQAVVAISSHHPVGIDTETLRPQLERVKDRYLSAREQRLFTTPLERLVAWCIKEAAYKIAGMPGLDLATGITIEPDNNRVNVPGKSFSYIIVEKTGTQATALVLPLQECLESECRPPR